MDSVYKNQQLKLLFTSLGSPDKEKMPDDEVRKDNIQQYLYTILEKINGLEEQTTTLQNEIKDIKDNYLKAKFTDSNGYHEFDLATLLVHLFVSAHSDDPNVSEKPIADILAHIYFNTK